MQFKKAIISVTSECKLGCKHCSVSKVRGEYPPSLWNEGFYNLKKYKFTHVVFSSCGEPLQEKTKTVELIFSVRQHNMSAVLETSGFISDWELSVFSALDYGLSTLVMPTFLIGNGKAANILANNSRYLFFFRKHLGCVSKVYMTGDNFHLLPGYIKRMTDHRVMTDIEFLPSPIADCYKVNFKRVMEEIILLKNDNYWIACSMEYLVKLYDDPNFHNICYQHANFPNSIFINNAGYFAPCNLYSLKMNRQIHDFNKYYNEYIDEYKLKGTCEGCNLSSVWSY